jgi:hypothetical protein
MTKSSPPSKPPNPFPDLPLAPDDYKLLADQYPVFLEALELLYVGENLSGRLMFLKEWPHAAQFIFGFELIEYDIKGTQDIARRRVLEDEADGRRVQFLDLLTDIENKSVDKGALKKQHIEYVVNTIGLEASQYIYAARTLEKLYPSIQPPEQVPEQAPMPEQPVAAPPPPPPPAPPPMPPAAPPAPAPVLSEPEIKLGPRVPAYKPYGDQAPPAPPPEPPTREPEAPPVILPPVPEPPPAPPLPEPEPEAVPVVEAAPLTEVLQPAEEKPRPKIRLFKKPNIVGPPPRVKKPPPESAS